MDPSYVIFLLAFLVFPLIGLILSKRITFQNISKFIKPVFLFFLVHNILFFAGYSVKGDYFDYVIFSLENFALFLMVFIALEDTAIKHEIIHVLGIILIIINFIVGLFGIFLFPLIFQDYETDKVFNFTNDGKNYETRRYSFGFVTEIDTRYTFETYRYYKYLPFEKKIDKTDFFALKTKLNIGEDKLKISVLKGSANERIEFKSTNGNSFSKVLH